MDKPIPEAVRAWLNAEGKFREAVETYNARVALVRAERERGNWPGGSIDPEYQAMEEARRASATSLRAMYDALTAAQQQGQAVACKHEHKHAEYDCVVCDDCGAIHTDSGKGWPVKNAWFASRALAKQPMQQGGGEVESARRLAVGLWQRHYREIAPEWEPCPDLSGLLSQIDNMASGLRRFDDTAPPSAPVGVEVACVERPGDPTFPQWEEVRSLIVPAPSAPVGVEELCDRLVKDWDAQGRMPQMAWDFRGFAADAIRRALAQQPAAVDEADR